MRLGFRRGPEGSRRMNRPVYPLYRALDGCSPAGLGYVFGLPAREQRALPGVGSHRPPNGPDEILLLGTANCCGPSRPVILNPAVAPGVYPGRCSTAFRIRVSPVSDRKCVAAWQAEIGLRELRRSTKLPLTLNIRMVTSSRCSPWPGC